MAGSALSRCRELAANADDHRRRGVAALAVADLIAEPIATDELARGEYTRAPFGRILTRPR